MWLAKFVDSVVYLGREAASSDAAAAPRRRRMWHTLVRFSALSLSMVASATKSYPRDKCNYQFEISCLLRNEVNLRG